MAGAVGREGRGTDPWTWAVPVVAAVLAGGVWSAGLDEPLFIALNRALSPGGAFWSVVTSLGDASVTLVLLLPFVGRRPGLVQAGILAAVLATICIQGLKSAFLLPRPAAVLDPSLIHVIGPELHARSFPSGHTATAFVLAGLVVLGLRPGRAWRRVVLVLAALVALSRIAVGAHWPVDVLVGAALGWGAAIAGLRLAGRWRAGLARPWQRGFALALLLAAADVLFLPDDYPDAAPVTTLIALAALWSSLRPLHRLFARRR